MHIPVMWIMWYMGGLEHSNVSKTKCDVGNKMFNGTNYCGPGNKIHTLLFKLWI